MRLRRTMLITPGHRRERLEKATGLQADSVVFDLEDGVPPARKAEARATVAAVLQQSGFGRRERAVRLNAIGSAAWQEDMAALPWAHVDAVLVPRSKTRRRCGCWTGSCRPG